MVKELVNVKGKSELINNARKYNNTLKKIEDRKEKWEKDKFQFTINVLTSIKNYINQIQKN
ncbi:MAG: hypothetical protein ACOCP8_07575 [archaeon]